MCVTSVCPGDGPRRLTVLPWCSVPPVVLPMVLPPVVGGAALLFAFGRRGLVGGPVYDSTGVLLPYSLWGVVAALSVIIAR